jgi:hypothetical protein
VIKQQESEEKEAQRVHEKERFNILTSEMGRLSKRIDEFIDRGETRVGPEDNLPGRHVVEDTSPIRRRGIDQLLNSGFSW